jgi:DNA polymerase-3 subunit delta'
MPSFKDITGHGRPLEILRRALTHDRLHHALLFAGPWGIGKEYVAEAVARALLCTDRHADGDSCGMCAACRRVGAGSHPDLRRLMSLATEVERGLVARDEAAVGGRRASREVRVDQVRELCHALSMRPFDPASGGQVAVVAEADRLTTEAMNCLLKTLEEPPAGTHLVLVTDRPHMLLPTIRSRCQRLDFFPLSDAETTDVLARRGHAGPDAARIARLSGGSPGRALVMLETAVLESRDRVVALVGALPDLAWPAVLDGAAELVRGGGDAAVVFDALGLWLRDLVVYQVTGDGARLLNRDRADDAARQTTVWDPPTLLAGLRDLARMRQQIDRNANPVLATERLLIELKRRLARNAGHAALPV